MVAVDTLGLQLKDLMGANEKTIVEMQMSQGNSLEPLLKSRLQLHHGWQLAFDNYQGFYRKRKLLAIYQEGEQQFGPIQSNNPRSRKVCLYDVLNSIWCKLQFHF